MRNRTCSLLVASTSSSLLSTCLYSNCEYSPQRSSPVSPQHRQPVRPKSVPYVVVGYGAAGRSAVQMMRKKDRRSAIMIVDPNNIDSNEVKRLGLHVHAGSVKGLNPHANTLTLDDESQVCFDKLLLCSGYSKMKLSDRFLDVQNVKLEDISSSSGQQSLTEAVLNGKHVTLVGSSWPVIKLAISLAKAARSKNYEGSVTLIMNCNGPLAAMVPRYVSEVVKAKLKSLKIEIVPYMHVRYIGGPDTLPPWAINTNASIAVYCTRTYDSMDSTVIATDNIGMSLDLLQDGGNTSDHFLSTAGLEFGNDGGIAVNKSMMATSNIYAAGDIANIWSSIGRGNFTGLSFARGTGEVAGENMVGGNRTYDDIPVYSTIDYNNDNDNNDTDDRVPDGDNLVDMRFIGNCSSAMESHGYWWKHSPVISMKIRTSSKASLSNSKNGNTKNNDEKLTFGSRFYKNLIDGVGSDEVATRREKPKNEGDSSNGFKGKRGISSSGSEKSLHSTDIFAELSTFNRNLSFGVVFYVDENDMLVGIMLSGLSLVASKTEQQAVIRNAKNIIHSKVSAAEFREYIIDNADNLQWIDEARFYSDRLLSVKVMESRALDIMSAISNDSIESSSLITTSRPMYRNSIPSKTAFLTDKGNKSSIHVPRVPIEATNVFQAGRSSQMRSSSRNTARIQG